MMLSGETDAACVRGLGETLGGNTRGRNPHRMTRYWFKIERHTISRRTAIIVAVATVIFAVAIAAVAAWMHLSLMSRG